MLHIYNVCDFAKVFVKTLDKLYQGEMDIRVAVDRDSGDYETFRRDVGAQLSCTTDLTAGRASHCSYSRNPAGIASRNQ